MKRALLLLLGLLLALVVLPPLWFALFPAPPPPELPAAGTRVSLEGGVAVNVLAEGQGPPVVMVHGLPGSAYEWRTTSAALASRGRRAIAYDRVGYGRSDPRSNGRYTPLANAAELHGVLRALDLRDVTLVGWSYGGVTGMLAAMDEDAEPRIGRLVLVGTGGPDSPDAEPPEPGALWRFFYSGPVLRWRASIPPMGVALMSALSDAAFSGGPQPDWWLPGLRANLSRRETLLAFRGEMLGLGGEAEPEDFDAAAVRLPTLLVHGDDDRLAPVGIARYLDGAIPDSRLQEVAGGSHMLPITHAELLADAIVGFEAP